MLWRRGKEEGLDEEKLLDVVFLGAMIGLITGRLGFVIEHWPEFGWQPNRWVDFMHYGGFSFWSAVVGAFLVLWLVGKRAKWNVWTVSDLAIFGVVWALILVRIGQFLDGSFFGRPTQLPIGVLFPGLEERRFPIQLFAVLFLLLVWWWLRRLEKQYRLFVWYQDKRGEARPGFITLTFLMVYAWFRFGLAFFRQASVYWGSLSYNQWVSLGVVGLGIVLFLERMRKWEHWHKQWQERKRMSKHRRLRTIIPKTNQPRRLKTRKRSHIKAGKDIGS